MTSILLSYADFRVNHLFTSELEIQGVNINLLNITERYLYDQLKSISRKPMEKRSITVSVAWQPG